MLWAIFVVLGIIAFVLIANSATLTHEIEPRERRPMSDGQWLLLAVACFVGAFIAAYAAYVAAVAQ
jgi:drug/metabolite transporter (DMT)-like permease